MDLICIKRCETNKEANSKSDSEKNRLDRWKVQNADILRFAAKLQLEFWGEDEETEDENEDIITQEMIDSVKLVKREEYDFSEMFSETFLDLDQIVRFLIEARKFEPKHDDKLQKLVRLLKSKELADQKVLIFTEFADTARYLKRQLDKAGITGVAQVDSATAGNRADIIQRFSPYYNGKTSAALVEIRAKVEKQIKNTYLKRVDAPIGVKPTLKCWMELNGG